VRRFVEQVYSAKNTKQGLAERTGEQAGGQYLFEGSILSEISEIRYQDLKTASRAVRELAGTGLGDYKVSQQGPVCDGAIW